MSAKLPWMAKIRVAVFPAAGLGTRFLPATKAQPKEMLPLVDRPLVQYVVEEARDAGIDRIVIVTGRGKNAIEDHFDTSFELERMLEDRGKNDLLEQVREVSDLIPVSYVRQKQALGLGHAVLQARDLVGAQPFAVMLGDDIVDSEEPCIGQMMRLFERRGNPVIALQEVPRSETHQYGIVAGEKVEDRVVRITDMMRVVSTAHEREPRLASRPFSRDRDGFVLAEGAWMFVLEDLERARARGARVYAEIRGYGATCDAHHRVRLDETGEESARAMTLAMAEAALPPEAIEYVAYHGTSTELNDRVETRAVRQAFGAAAGAIPGSSVKSMIGHPQGACGAAGLAATVLGMRDGFLPPTINLGDPDPECDLDYVANRSRPASFSNALCNCIGFGSKNSALVVSRS